MSANRTLCFALLIGCGGETLGGPAPGGSATPPLEPPTAPGCRAQVALDGSAGAARATAVGPWLIDSQGADVCLHLDATRLQRAHFLATTEYFAGAASPFEATLRDAAGGVLRQGWDVTIGESDVRSACHLEQSFPGGEARDVVLQLRARGAAAGATLSLSLVEPLVAAAPGERENAARERQRTQRTVPL